MKTVRLITCDSSFQARLILGALENEGIAGILHNENSSNILKGYINCLLYTSPSPRDS